MKYVIAFAFVMSSMALGGCKQGVGARCQVNADCKGPLACNLATQTCQGESEGDLDAPPPPIDAAPDAKVDDAAPTDGAPHD